MPVKITSKELSILIWIKTNDIVTEALEATVWAFYHKINNFFGIKIIYTCLLNQYLFKSL